MRPVPRYATVSNIDENHINSTDVTFIEKNTSDRKQFHEEAFSATDEMYILVQLNTWQHELLSQSSLVGYGN